MTYELVELQKGDFQDNHGNYWCTAVFKGVGEPVKWVLKDPTKVTVGESYDGKIEEKTSKANKPYLRFYRNNPQQNFSGKSGGGNTGKDDEYWEEKNLTIRAQWAIGQAMTKFEEGCYEATDENRVTLLANIKDFAKELFVMVDEVKDTQKEIDNQQLIGTKIANQVDDVAPMPNDEDAPINLDDIPF